MIAVRPSRPGNRKTAPSLGEQRQPVRVCFLIDELSRAGTETQLLALIRHLDRSCVQPYLCLLRGESEASRALEPADCPVLRMDVRSFHRAPAVLWAARLARFLRRERIEVLQVYFPDSSLFGTLIGRLAGVPHIIRTRNNLGYALTSLYRLLGRWSNRLARLTVANCEACRQSLLADEGPPPDKVIVLENGVDLERFLALPSSGHSTGPRRVGMVGNLRPVKDPELLLRAAAIVCAAHSDVTFEIAGEGPLRPRLKALANEIGLATRFRLRGAITDVPEFLARLDVAVLCSQSEGMSNALLEYMASARPVVATAVGGNTELIEEGVHGLLVPPGNPHALARAINRLLEDRDLAGRLATAARHRARERFSREAMVRRFENLYLSLTGREA